MDKIVLPYSRKLVRRSAWLGAAYLLVGLASVIFGTYSLVVFMVMGIFMLMVAYYQHRYPYVVLEDGKIRIGFRNLRLNELKSVKFFAGDLSLSDGRRELTINGNMVADADRAQFEQMRGIFEKYASQHNFA